ncbi:MAG: ribonuclease HII [Gammaproteobacteria bacterium]|nr:ribonuclease HII [Gammaproteobacteria bacterium]NBT45213.1 ribonuclease HII [Gammaproteobacteria bacterium]NBY24035.1 ribonuclease HII [Gammaproteobacteria bacterium]
MVTAAMDITAGFDEAGRGCLAGPVIAAAVILPLDGHPIAGLDDSKRLSAKARIRLADIIKTEALAFAVGRAEPLEIDQYNILRASLLAMQRAFQSLSLTPTYGLIDGPHCPDLPFRTKGIIHGDRWVPSISAASILAKVARDEEMVIADTLFPGYGFAIHKGYPTAAHREALRTLGPSPIHRMSFKPLKAVTPLLGAMP